MNRRFYGIAFVFFIIFLAGCRSAATAPPGQAEAETADSPTTQQPPPTAVSTPTAEPSAAWQIIKQLQPEHKPKYAAFMNELFGVTGCGENFQPSFTSDGGQTWNRPAMGNYCPNSVEIVNGRSIWMCNTWGLFTSKDGGRTLSQMYNPFDGCRVLSFIDDENGWSSLEWNIAATTDGALRWVEVEKAYDMGELAAISLRTPQDGYVLDYYGKLFTTHDGGQSWSSTTLGFDEGRRIANMDGRSAAAIRFQDDDNGIIILNLVGSGYSDFLAFHTVDGGQSWERHLLPLNLGAVYLSLDGQYLTVTEHGGSEAITILKKQTAD